jgi:uncharacterized membrane protein
MQMLRQRDFWAGAMFVLFGLFFVVGARDYTFGGTAKMGPGFFPTILGFILAGLGIVITVLSFSRARDPLPQFVWRPLLILIVAICLYGVLLPTAGFVLGTVVLIVVGARADPESRLLESLILGVLLSVFSTAVLALVKARR